MLKTRYIKLLMEDEPPDIIRFYKSDIYDSNLPLLENIHFDLITKSPALSFHYACSILKSSFPEGVL